MYQIFAFLMPSRFLRNAVVVLLTQETVGYVLPQPRLSTSPRAGGVAMTLAPEGFVWSEVPEVREHDHVEHTIACSP